MPRNSNESPYFIPRSMEGYTLEKVSTKFEKNFYASVREMAADHTEKYGNKISPAVLLMNIALKNRELKARYNQKFINEEKITDEKNTTERIAKDFK